MALKGAYRLLIDHFGPRGWWPGETSHEHFVGCILAQNTRWERVIPVIERLKSLNALSPEAYLQLPTGDLEELLRGSGTFRRKAEYLRNAGEYMLSRGWDGSSGSVTVPTGDLRNGLLKVKGIGPETCDCILLYVLARPVFVVDAYTVRILSRHGLCGKNAAYGEVQGIFQRELEPDVKVFREYHALLVECGKRYCRPSPGCRGCPLNGLEREC